MKLPNGLVPFCRAYIKDEKLFIEVDVRKVIEDAHIELPSVEVKIIDDKGCTNILLPSKSKP